MVNFVLAVVVLMQCSAHCSAAAIARNSQSRSPWAAAHHAVAGTDGATGTRTPRNTAARGSRPIAPVASATGGRKVMYMPKYVIPDGSPVDPCVTCHPRMTTPEPSLPRPCHDAVPGGEKRYGSYPPAAVASKTSRTAAVASKTPRTAATATKTSRTAAVASKTSRTAAVATETSRTAAVASMTSRTAATATKTTRTAAVATETSWTAAVATRTMRPFSRGTGVETRTRRKTATRPVAQSRRRIAAGVSTAGGGDGTEVASDGGDDRKVTYTPRYTAKMQSKRPLERQGKLENHHFEWTPDFHAMKRADKYDTANGSERLKKSKMRRRSYE